MGQFFQLRKKIKLPENIVKCEVCGKEIYRKSSYIQATQHITCSYGCAYKLRSELYTGEGNHQFGLKGDLNSSWKADEKITY